MVVVERDRNEALQLVFDARHVPALKLAQTCYDQSARLDVVKA